MVSHERQKEITEQLIRIYNDGDIPNNIKWDAVKVESRMNGGHPKEEVEEGFQKVLQSLEDYKATRY